MEFWLMGDISGAHSDPKVHPEGRQSDPEVPPWGPAQRRQNPYDGWTFGSCHAIASMPLAWINTVGA